MENLQPSYPVQISFKDIQSSDAVRQNILNRSSKLEKYFDRIISSEVKIECKRQRQGRCSRFRVNIHLDIPGKNLVVSKEPGDNEEHIDLYVTIRDAFQSMERQLKAHSAHLRRDEKVEMHSPVGKIAWFSVEKGYGFIRSPSNRDIYFHENSLINIRPEEISEGDNVRFDLEQGQEGLQAKSVAVLGKSGLHSDDFERARRAGF